MYDINKIVIVGATGYLGNSIFKSSKISCPVIGTSTKGENGFNKLSLEDFNFFDYSIIKENDTILFSGAISSPHICSQENDFAYKVNVIGSSEFIERAISLGARVIFFSSDTVYGNREKKFDEGATCNPAGQYAEMKHEVEQKFLGNPLFKTIRLSYVFSKEDKFSQYLLGCVNRNEEAELFHPILRAIVHRDDVILGVISLATHWETTPENIINFGGAEILSRVDFARCLKKKYIKNLRYNVKEPSAKFFENRPRVISMYSPIFSRLLGRSPLLLSEAADYEFKNK